MIDRSLFGMSARLHHVGIAAQSISEVDPAIEATYDPIQRVRVGFFNLHDLVIELVEPAGENSPIQRSLDNGVRLLHLCFEVDRIEDAVKTGRSHGFLPIRPPAPAAAFSGRRITWLFNKHFGLVELLERAS